MIEKEYARSQLSGKAVELFDDITLSRVLGASKQSVLIGEILRCIVSDKEDSPEKIVEKVSITSGFFKETRGQNSRAIYNAINMMCKGLGQMKHMNTETIREKMNEQIDGYKNQTKKSAELITEYASSLCDSMSALLVFDYSSTVEAFLSGIKKKKIVYIPESRALNGGHPFVKSAVEAGHEVHFIPDTAMMDALRRCDAAFMGAETLYPDGSVFNTIGSDILAVLCQALQVPLYVLSPLLKVDLRPIQGYVRLAPMPFDYRNRLASDWESEFQDAVDFRGIKLVKVPQNQITAIISEAGIIPGSAFFDTAVNYGKSLEMESEG